MKILIITQAVDKENTTLAFFENWIRKISLNYEKVTVICLYKGKYDLPQNVEVLSLGKEFGFSRSSYIKNFYRYIWQKRADYDTVFVHMNQEYILLGGLLWKIWGKSVYMWRNHPHGDLLTRIAIFLSDKVFCTSKESFTARFKKTKIMPVGVDTSLFYEDSTVNPKPSSLLMFGRVSRVKKVDLTIDALSSLEKNGMDCTLHIVGDVSFSDKPYAQSLDEQVSQLGLKEKVVFSPGVHFSEARDVYASHEIFINVTPLGSFDKTIFESMACGCILVTTNTSLRDILPPEYIALPTTDGLADSIKNLFSMSVEQKSILREKARILIQSQSLDHLIGLLIKEMK